MRRVSILAALIIVAASASFAQNGADTKKFLTEVIEGNYAEVELGQLPQTNAQSDEVKSFGQMLVTDHGAANKKAIAVAKTMDIAAPTGPNAKQKADYKKLSTMKGATFDRQFTDQMAEDHKKNVEKYRKQAKSKDASGPYAQETLPIIEGHLQHALELQKKLSK